MVVNTACLADQLLTAPIVDLHTGMGCGGVIVVVVEVAAAAGGGGAGHLPAVSTLLQYNFITIAQYTTHPDPPCMGYKPYNLDNDNIV